MSSKHPVTETTADQEAVQPLGAATRKPRRRRLLLSAVGVVMLGLLWIVVTGLIARWEGQNARRDLGQLKAELARGDSAAVQGTESQMQRDAAAAHARTTGPAWWLGAHVPFFGQPLKSARATTVVVDHLAQSALPAAVRAGRALDPTLLHKGPGQVDPARLAAAAGPVAAAASATTPFLSAAAHIPSGGWLPTAANARRAVVEEIGKLHRGLSDLATATKLLPSTLGLDGTKRYFVAFQTDAEARGLGGLPGSYGILQARHGQLTFTRFGSDTDLKQAHANVDFGRAYRWQYNEAFSPNANFINSDPSPHFPYAALTWMSMWQGEFHQRLDGAITTDPHALAGLLGAVGSVRLHDGTVITGDNAEKFFESTVYARFRNHQAARKRYLVNAARAIAARVTNEPSSDLLRTASALQQAANERRLLVYTRDKTVERELSSRPLGGFLPQTTQPFLDLIVNNETGSKLDYYLDRSVTYRRSTCAATTATVTVTLHNGAPTSGLPAYVSGLAAPGRNRAGFSESLVSLFTTAGSKVRNVRIAGHGAYTDVEHERGHPVTIVDVGLAPGQSKTLTYNVHEPAATGPMIALQQPLVRPLHQTIQTPTCPATSATG
jgi:hypothetical protein